LYRVSKIRRSSCPAPDFEITVKWEHNKNNHKKQEEGKENDAHFIYVISETGLIWSYLLKLARVMILGPLVSRPITGDSTQLEENR